MHQNDVKSTRQTNQNSLKNRPLPSACLIINPAAGRGRIRAAIPAIRNVFRERGIATTYETSAPGDEETLARRAIQEGVQTIVAVGASGTGNDFAKTLGVARSSPAEIADLVVRGGPSLIDVGRADGHYYLNSCGFGFDASVLEASYKVRFLRGDAVYIYSALR